MNRCLLLGIDEQQYAEMSDAAKEELDLTERAELRRLAGIDDERDRRILAYSHFARQRPTCHHP